MMHMLLSTIKQPDNATINSCRGWIRTNITRVKSWYANLCTTQQVLQGKNSKRVSALCSTNWATGKSCSCSLPGRTRTCDPPILSRSNFILRHLMYRRLDSNQQPHDSRSRILPIEILLYKSGNNHQVYESTWQVEVTLAYDTLCSL